MSSPSAPAKPQGKPDHDGHRDRLRARFAKQGAGALADLLSLLLSLLGLLLLLLRLLLQREGVAAGVLDRPVVAGALVDRLLLSVLPRGREDIDVERG